MILTYHLFTKAALIRYTKAHGTAAMRSFVDRHIRQLKDYIEDAVEWDAAEETESLENETDWALLCRVSDGQCQFGGEACGYRKAVSQIFEHNSATFDWRALASALRAIIVGGPAKETPVPMLIGSTNSGKSTVCLPFDALFGFKCVLHKPAKSLSVGLRNITKGKRFIFWDDFRRVEYAMLPKQPVPVDTFLSIFQGLPFEVQASQSFKDGNIDWSWERGAVITAKEKELWAPRTGVTEEDIKHMRSRLCEFTFSTIPAAARVAVKPCPHCLARWIRDGAAAADAAGALAAPWQPRAVGLARAEVTLGVAPTLVGQAVGRDEPILGFAGMMQRAALPEEARAALHQGALALGAIDVRELTAADWQAMSAWQALRPLQQRRILALIG